MVLKYLNGATVTFFSFIYFLVPTKGEVFNIVRKWNIEQAGWFIIPQVLLVLGVAAFTEFYCRNARGRMR